MHKLYLIFKLLNGLMQLLDTLDSWIKEFPPVDQPQRFGNKAFRSWFAKMKEVISPVVCIYLQSSFSQSFYSNLLLYLLNYFFEGMFLK